MDKVLAARPNATRAEDYLLLEEIDGYRVLYDFEGYFAGGGGGGLREVLASRPFNPTDNIDDLFRSIQIKGDTVCREFESKDARIVFRGIVSPTEEILAGIEPPYVTPGRNRVDTNAAVVAFRWRQKQGTRPRGKLVSCDTGSSQ